MYGLVSRIQDNDETADVMFESVGIKRLAASVAFEHFASRGFEFSLLAGCQRTRATSFFYREAR